MILISSMGGCGSTTFISWFRKHIHCNCPLNSEGLPKPGPGANHKGLKHRIRPPGPHDQLVPIGHKVERAVFLFDSPYDIVPSLFRRKIAMGHAIAITGSRPDHDNDLEKFAGLQTDSFGFTQQFRNWTGAQPPVQYPRLLIRSSEIWQYLEVVGYYLGIPPHIMSTFPERQPRKSSFANLTAAQRTGLRAIYESLNAEIEAHPHIKMV